MGRSRGTRLIEALIQKCSRIDLYAKRKKNTERAWLDKDDQGEFKGLPPETRGSHHQLIQVQHPDGAFPSPGDVAMGSAVGVDEALLWGSGSARLVIIREAVIAAKNFMATMRENRVD